MQDFYGMHYGIANANSMICELLDVHDKHCGISEVIDVCYSISLAIVMRFIA